MGAGVNECRFIGRLGADPETRYTPSGQPVARFRIACDWKRQDKEGTEWVPIVAWGKRAETCATYLRKGSQVWIGGHFTTQKWQDRDGTTRYRSEIVADDLRMLGPKPPAAPTSQGAAPASPPATGSTGPAKSDPDYPFDDDIPF